MKEFKQCSDSNSTRNKCFHPWQVTWTYPSWFRPQKCSFTVTRLGLQCFIPYTFLSTQIKIPLCLKSPEARLQARCASTLLHSRYLLDWRFCFQTERTMTELEIAVNQRVGEWEVIQESGTTLRPLFGPGLTGMKNLGNSCYLNSVMQVLFTIPDFQSKSVTPTFSFSFFYSPSLLSLSCYFLWQTEIKNIALSQYSCKSEKLSH